MVGIIILVVGLATIALMFIEVRQTDKQNCTCNKGYCAWCHSAYYGY